MSAGQDAEKLAAQAAETVRRVIAEAETRGAEIVREAEVEAARVRETAESDASQIRERAEADARAQIDAARKALDELGGSLAAAVSEAPVGASRAEAPEPEPEPQPEPEPETPVESPGAPETPVSPPAPQPDQTGVSAANGDDAAERLVAMKLAVEGTDPAAIEAELNERFGPGDRSALLRDVLARLPR
jgi:hypothetical protein